MKKAISQFVIIVLILLPSLVFSDTIVGNSQGFHVDAGYMRQLDNSKPSDKFYYDVKMNGSQISGSGSPLTFDDINKPVFQNSTTAAKTLGDVNVYNIRLRKGTAQINGGVFDLVGRKPFEIQALSQLRGVANISGTLDGKQINISLGLETPSYHPLSHISLIDDLNWTNWIIFGVSGETRPKQTGIATNTDYGMVTYRAFLGKGWGWVTSKETKYLRYTEPANILKQYPTMDSAKSLNQEVKKIITEGNAPSATQAAIFDVYNRAGTTEANWKDLITAKIHNQLMPADQPTAALWLDDFGWYSFAGNEPHKRLNNIFGATFTWWLTPEEAKSFVRFIYEYGNDKTDPTVRRNFVAATVGLDF
jgi:hypothetical protein